MGPVQEIFVAETEQFDSQCELWHHFVKTNNNQDIFKRFRTDMTSQQLSISIYINFFVLFAQIKPYDFFAVTYLTIKYFMADSLLYHGPI